MHRVGRKINAWLCISALVFMQFAVAAHACATASSVAIDTGVSAADGAAHSPCEPDDQQRSKLCEQHCVQTLQSVDTQPQAAPAVPSLRLIGVVDHPCLDVAGKRSRQRAWLASAVDPPPLVRFAALRI